MIKRNTILLAVLICVFVCVLNFKTNEPVGTADRSSMSSKATLLMTIYRAKVQEGLEHDNGPRAVASSAPAPAKIIYPSRTTAKPFERDDRPLVVFYDSGQNSWEYDYIYRDLLGDDYHIVKREYNPMDFDPNDDIFVESSEVRALIAFTRLTACDTVGELLKVFQKQKRLLVVLLLSDEYGGSVCIHEMTARLSPLVLRQYHHLGYKDFPNVHQIPLGARSGRLPLNHNYNYYRPIHERNYTWTFIGSNKSDRALMVKVLQNLTPNYYDFGYGGQVDPKFMMELYNNSIFVPIGRGNVVHDCFRLYEAMAIGAVPVIVANEQSVNMSFTRFVGNVGRRPPALYASTWTEAAKMMRSLMTKREELRALQVASHEYLLTTFRAARQLLRKYFIPPSI